jgi:hypothetical protein
MVQVERVENEAAGYYFLIDKQIRRPETIEEFNKASK